MVPSGVFSSWAVPAASVPNAASRSAASAPDRVRSSSASRRRSEPLIRSVNVPMKTAATTKATHRPRACSTSWSSPPRTSSGPSGISCKSVYAAMLTAVSARLQRGGSTTAAMVMCTRYSTANGL